MKTSEQVPTNLGKAAGRAPAAAHTGIMFDMTLPLGKFISGNLSRKTLLLLNSIIFLSYFGTLALAIWLFPGGYNWRRKSISKLLYPESNPRFHFIASLGIAVTGLLIVPFAGYISRRLRDASPIAANFGGAALAAGGVCLILAGLVVSHPSRGAAAFSRVHEVLARGSASAIGAGMLAFYECALRANFSDRYGKTLLVLWSMLTLPAVLIALLRLAAAARLAWSNPIYGALKNPTLWHLGFWEWIGSAAAFLFLFSGVVLLPEHPCP
jgi:hypothetical protein